MNNADYLYALRHSAEHVLHQAVKELYPSIHLAMGPATDDGFYFDFDSSPEGKEKITVTESDFPRIEKRMRELIDKDIPITKEIISPEQARTLFADNPYKLEWISIAEEKGQDISIYWTGKPGEEGSMVDLCAGPHVSSTGEIKAFALLSMAGAYWHGDEKNKMLTRIYGTAFSTQKKLDAYLFMREEAKKRDHKKLGKELDLFVFSDLVGPGLPLWTPKGTCVRNLLDAYVWKLREEKGYSRVEIPHITKKELYETSGHWDKFSDELFKITTREGHEFAMKPMNCPHHTQIYARKKWSFRELPQRYANTTTCYRDEQTGELSGLSRVRAFSQDDAHVFCRFDQVKEEFLSIWDIVQTFYATFGFDLNIRLSLHDPQAPEKYLGGAEKWKQAEDMLRDIVKEKNVEASEALGEAAFYGPKIDFMAHDSLGREWQVATIQLDMNMPERFDLSCVNESGEDERIVMIHAAIMGSIERFLSILIEHYAGAFPFWLSPVQVKVIPIAERHNEYAATIEQSLKDAGIRVNVDEKSESMQKKIRNAQKEKINFMIIVGDTEIKTGEINVRNREGKTESMKLEAFVTQAQTRVEQKIDESKKMQ